MIKAVIFDWGGVLIDNPANALLSYCATHLGVTTSQFSEVFHKYNELFDIGKLTEEDLWDKVTADLKVELPKTKSLWGDAFKSVYSPKKGVWDLVRNLKKHYNFKTAILSNTEMPAVAYFQKNNLREYFDQQIFSCVEGVRKPYPEIYQIALDKLSVKPEEAVFIDDREDYVEGAKIVGLRAILFQNSKQLEEELASHGVRVYS